VGASRSRAVAAADLRGSPLRGASVESRPGARARRAEAATADLFPVMADPYR